MATLSDLVNNGLANQRMLFDDTLFTEFAKMKVLTALNSHGATYATPRVFGESSGYQVPAGKKFIVMGIRIASNTPGFTTAALGSADADVGFNSGSPPTGDISITYDIPASAAIGTFKYSLVAPIPENKYLSINNGSAGGGFAAATIIYGFEIDADATVI